MRITPTTWSELGETEKSALLRRPAVSHDSGIRDSVTAIINDVRTGGDKALRSLTKQYDDVEIDEFRVSSGEIAAAYEQLTTEQLAAIDLIADAGLAWSEGDFPELKFERETAERVPVFSAGASTRFNLFGYTVLEIFSVYPFQRPDKGAHFGFQIVPGW